MSKINLNEALKNKYITEEQLESMYTKSTIQLPNTNYTLRKIFVIVHCLTITMCILSLLLSLFLVTSNNVYASTRKSPNPYYGEMRKRIAKMQEYMSSGKADLTVYPMRTPQVRFIVKQLFIKKYLPKGTGDMIMEIPHEQVVRFLTACGTGLKIVGALEEIEILSMPYVQEFTCKCILGRYLKDGIDIGVYYSNDLADDRLLPKQSHHKRVTRFSKALKQCVPNVNEFHDEVVRRYPEIYMLDAIDPKGKLFGVNKSYIKYDEK